jgi:hypothetical protein
VLRGTGRGEEAVGGPGPVGTVHSANCLNIFQTDLKEFNQKKFLSC